ncbi:hypothetical protein [Micromonospora chalcea]|uniref:hypothetical protein n=1 Tax=Micromonospora chalcea TaxID=1874 RepID=UPI0037BC5B62
MMHPDTRLGVGPDRGRQQDVHVVGEACGVLDPVQVGRRRAGDRRAGWHPQQRRAAGQRMVAVEPRVGVDVLPEPDPGRAPQMVPGQQPAPDRF